MRVQKYNAIENNEIRALISGIGMMMVKRLSWISFSLDYLEPYSPMS